MTVTRIRPNQLLSLTPRNSEWIAFQIPARGGLIALESVCLVALSKIVDAKNFF